MGLWQRVRDNMRFGLNEWYDLLIKSLNKNLPCSPRDYGMSVNTQKKKKRGGAKK